MMFEDSEQYFDASSDPDTMEDYSDTDHINIPESQSEVNNAEKNLENVDKLNRIEEPSQSYGNIHIKVEPSECTDQTKECDDQNYEIHVNEEPSKCVDQTKACQKENVYIVQNNLYTPNELSTYVDKSNFDAFPVPSVCLENEEQSVFINQFTVNEPTELSVYVDETILAHIDENRDDVSNNKYKINNDTFWDIEYSNNDKNLTEFEIFAKKCEDDNFFTMNKTCDTYCSTPTDTDISDEVSVDILKSKELNFTYQKAPQGIIINSNVYVTDNQWNTLVFVDLKTVQCVVCDMYSDFDTTSDHIASANHKENLDAHKPLDKFDLSITRKIKDKYHCAVCNELFDLENESNHYTSKSHEGSLLFAVNKVFDIMYDCDMSTENKKSKDFYHFNAKAINNISMLDDIIDEVESNDDFYLGNDYKLYGDNDIEKDDYEYYYENSNYNISNKGASYATMAKKPKGDKIPKILVKDVGNKKIQISFDSWHMIIKTTLNEFYCMVCKEYGHITLKAKHSKTMKHLDQLNSCKILDKYEDHFIRKVDDRLYHCSHCNNLQLIHELDNHIETTHSNKSRKLSESSSVQNSVNSENLDDKTSLASESESNLLNTNDTTENVEFIATVNEKNITKSNTLERNSNIINPKVNSNNSSSVSHNNKNINPITKAAAKIPSIDIYEDIVLYHFGYKLKVPFLNYNVVCKKIDSYFCGICNTLCPENDLVSHVYNLQHIESLQRTPFIMVFGFHLIRSIREMFHCTLCNMPMHPEFVYAHNMQEMHLDLLKNALGITNFAVITPKETKIAPNFSKPTFKSATTKPELKNTIVGRTSLTAVKPIKQPDNIVDLDKATEMCVDEIEDFIEIPRDLKLCENEVNDSFESELDLFDIGEYIYIKLKTKYTKITNTAYNSLVCVGDGSRYCFVCTCRVEFHELNKHVESRTHFENIEKYKFLDKYEDHLLRQFYLMYHCGICNVLVSRKQLKHHLSWPIHTLQNEHVNKNMKKQRRNDLKTGMKEIIGLTQKEDIYLKGSEAKINIVFNIQIADKDKRSSTVLEKRNKIIICNDVVLKVKWAHWHGISDIKGGYKCRICQKEVTEKELSTHVMGQWHNIALDIPLETRYSTALLRKINDLTIHCLICNTEITNNENILDIHIGGKKHCKNYESILQETSVADSYADCSDDVLMI